MATYKYQQNFYEGASAGYVQYNITPDFGAVMAPGDTFEITGKMYCGDMKRYGVAIEASIQENGFGRELGRVVKTVSKGGSAAFSAQCTVTEALANTASERGFSAYLTFMLADAEDFASGAYTMANEAQKLSLLKYRLSPEISGVAFSDATGAYEYFGGAVQGKSDLTAAADVTLDPLDASLYIRSARIRFGDHAIDIPGENISGSALHIGVPGFSGEFENYELQITDSSGMTGSYTGGPFAAYPYEAPRLETIGRDLVERYEVITSDDGTEIAQISDAGTSLWANFAVGTSDINGRNAWVLKRSFAESGFTLPDGEQVLAGNGGESIAVSEDRSIFPCSMVFSAGKRYTVRLEISDFFEKAIQVFDVDKAGGYFNVEKNGVSAGMRSTATEDQPKFESAYPFYAYGGIHGVTNYSTDEVKTGGTWVDGKPIYRMIVTASGSLATGAVITSQSFAGVDTVISLSGALVRSDGVRMAIPTFSGENYFVSCEIDASGTMKLYKGTSITTGYIIVVVEYTKTTDEEPGSGEGDETVTPVTYPTVALTSANSSGYVVKASSEYSSKYAAWKAFNKSYSDAQGWASSASDSAPWLYIELPKAIRIRSIKIANRTFSSGVNGVINAKVNATNDVSSWTQLGTISGRNGAAGGLVTTHEISSGDVAYKYVGIDPTSWNKDAGSYVSIGEIYITGFE